MTRIVLRYDFSFPQEIESNAQKCTYKTFLSQIVAVDIQKEEGIGVMFVISTV